MDIHSLIAHKVQMEMLVMSKMGEAGTRSPSRILCLGACAWRLMLPHGSESCL